MITVFLCDNLKFTELGGRGTAHTLKGYELHYVDGVPRLYPTGKNHTNGVLVRINEDQYMFLLKYYKLQGAGSHALQSEDSSNHIHCFISGRTHKLTAETRIDTWRE